MKRYLLVRSFQSVLLIWLIITFLFFFFRLIPGDYLSLMVLAGADQATVDRMVQQWGLDRPLYAQYWSYLTNMLQLDAGTSLQYRGPVWEVVRLRLFNSAILIAPAITAAYVLGTIYGTVAGFKRGSAIEKYGIIPIIFVGSFPAFFLAIILVVVFSGWLDWFPTSGILSAGVRSEFRDAPWWGMYLTTNFAWHYVLPFTAIVLRYLFLPSLIMRTSVVEVGDQAFMQYHRLTGISKTRQLRHLARHASLPVITLYPVSMTRAIGGLVLIEVVFNWPGVGYLLVSSVLARDFPVLQFVFILVGVFIVLANFLVDVLYGVIDPRVSVGSER